MKQFNLLLLTAFALSMSACGAGAPGAPILSDSLELTYVSGHLGIYADCPSEALTEAPSQADPAPGASMAGPCHPDDKECLTGSMNCEQARVSIRIKNIGSDTLTGINVVELQLLSMEEAVLHSMPIEMVYVPAELEDGLEPGEEVLVHVEFKGPASSGWEMISHPVHILVIDSQNEGAELTTPPLESLGMMVT